MTTAAWGQLYSSQITATSLLVKLGPNDTGASVVEPISFGGAGASAQSAPNVAMLVQKGTNLGGRKGRGRLFIPGVPEASVDPSGIIAAGTITALNAVLGDFITDLQTNDVPMVLLHSDSTTPTPVTSLNINATAATQRRRLRR
jgi:hypothetical protein